MAAVTAPPRPEDWLTRKQAATFLASLGCPLAVQTLANYAVHRNRGGGPPFTRVRWKIVRYKRSDLMAWAVRHAVRVE